MSGLDNQGSLPAHVEHERGRSARAKDVPADPETGEAELADAPEPPRDPEPTSRAPFEPSTGEPDDG